MKLMLFLASGLLSSAYAFTAGWQSHALALGAMAGEYQKPFIYRALIPLAAQGLLKLGIAPEVSIMVLVIASGLLLAYSIRTWLKSMYDANAMRLDITTLIILALVVMLLIKDVHVYDLPTVSLFTLCLTLIHRLHSSSISVSLS